MSELRMLAFDMDLSAACLKEKFFFLFRCCSLVLSKYTCDDATRNTHEPTPTFVGRIDLSWT